MNLSKKLVARWGWFVSPALMIAVALLQQVLARSQSLTAWKGGGFGMFSTVDSRSARFLRAYVTTANGEVPVQLPRALAPIARRLRSMPTHPGLERLAEGMLEATWVPRRSARERVPASGVVGSPAPTGRLRARQDDEPLSDPPVAVAAVRVELWRYVFAAESAALVARKIDEVRRLPASMHPSAPRWSEATMRTP
jgi:hypothetical protein